MKECYMVNLNIGDKVQVSMSNCGYVSMRKEKYEGVIEMKHQNYITVNTGKYRVTVNMPEVICREVEIKKYREGRGYDVKKDYETTNI
ncbi:MAG: hypothetical protein ACPLRZ_07770 [Thermovenabulum sp.]|uniref:hypothetical protein n=1 Tax=Thermovenabulum sp. TaxID=3100335 RepID=UPI003C7BF8BF